MAIRDVLARIGDRGRPPIDLERLADLDAEEALFRLWWRTLPDKVLAQRQFHQYVAYYCREKDLAEDFRRELDRRCSNLRGDAT